MPRLYSIEPARPGPARALVESAPPNIVVIMTDDLSLNTLNDGIVNGWLPNLKSNIIDRGMTFANSFVANAVCGPSRATFLTGQHTHNHGVLNNEYPTGGVTRLDDSSTLATWLRSAGYRNGLVGKYLNGYGLNLDPASPTDDPTYIAPGWDDWRVSLGLQMYNYSMNLNGTLVHYGSQPADYATDVLAGHAADFINDSEAGNDAQPFFLWVATSAPHANNGVLCAVNNGTMGPYLPAPRHVGAAGDLLLPRPPSFNEANVADKPTWLKNSFPLLNSSYVSCLKKVNRGRAETMMAVDDLIGTIVSTLQATGELGNTVLVFTSDNGFLLGEHRSNAKAQAYEEAIRVPLYIRTPGMLGPQTGQQMVVNTDLGPTFMELAQGGAGLVTDGRSLVPVLQDPAFSPWRNYFLSDHTWLSGDFAPDFAAVRSAQYLWVEYRNGQRELYDFPADPFELTSRHDSPAYGGVRAALAQVLQTLEVCAGNTCWQ